MGTSFLLDYNTLWRHGSTLSSWISIRWLLVAKLEHFSSGQFRSMIRCSFTPPLTHSARRHKSSPQLHLHL